LWFTACPWLFLPRTTPKLNPGTIELRWNSAQKEKERKRENSVV